MGIELQVGLALQQLDYESLFEHELRKSRIRSPLLPPRDPHPDTALPPDSPNH